jgi:hypothetical protein
MVSATMYQHLYQQLSGPTQAPCFVCCSVSVCPAPACGVQGALVGASSTPCFWGFPWQPLTSSRAPDARSRSLSPKSKGSAPAPQRSIATAAARLALRWRSVKLAPLVGVGVSVFVFRTNQRAYHWNHFFRMNDELLSGKGMDRFDESGNFAIINQSVESHFYLFPPIVMDATTEATKAKQPLKVFRHEDVSLSVFANDRQVKGKQVTFYNFTTSKSYKKGDEMLRTQTFGSDDINRLCYLLKEAEEYIQTFRNSLSESDD